MDRTITRHIVAQQRFGFSGQNCTAVFSAFAVAYEDAVFVGLDIRQAQFRNFAKPYKTYHLVYDYAWMDFPNQSVLVVRKTTGTKK